MSFGFWIGPRNFEEVFSSTNRKIVPGQRWTEKNGRENTLNNYFLPRCLPLLNASLVKLLLVVL